MAAVRVWDGRVEEEMDGGAKECGCDIDVGTCVVGCCCRWDKDMLLGGTKHDSWSLL